MRRRTFFLGAGAGAVAFATSAGCSDPAPPPVPPVSPVPSGSSSQVNDPANLDRINNPKSVQWADPLHGPHVVPGPNGEIKLDSNNQHGGAYRSYVGPGSDGLLVTDGSRTLAVTQKVQIDSRGGSNGGKIFLLLRTDGDLKDRIDSPRNDNYSGNLMNMIVLQKEGNGMRAYAGAFASSRGRDPEKRDMPSVVRNETGGAESVSAQLMDIKDGDTVTLTILCNNTGARLHISNGRGGTYRVDVLGDFANTMSCYPSFGARDGAVGTFDPVKVGEMPYGLDLASKQTNIALSEAGNRGALAFA